MTSDVRVAYGQNVFGRSLVAEAEGVERWRREAAEVLRSWGASLEAVELVRLGVSELLSNVHRHVAVRRCYLRIVRIGSEVTVQVFDRSLNLPVVREEPDDESESGRGLWMLREMASGFGCERTEQRNGKIVWFRCELGDLP
ncbi:MULTISPECIES: ATP-binding protein [unclassified Streptomyces]|uniref:ATP-binding protein n=1 Tax=unclassified Streptomyces TaxID=2593676 RepID=UPI0019083D21|nr:MULTISPECIES: ATP-binding protein [unclassified Streptomyces]MCU4745605.1 ATP-binding protein [Streptomyces sp. G-5]QQN79402.1 ATP-binding protein [Streptomyces sp. XC 2026]